jgi:alpha-methylacyl-CoA racemase
MDQGLWPELKEKVRACIRTKTRAEWCEIMEASDVCFAPVLTMGEAAEHPHNVERGTFVNVNGHMQPAPAPRFSRTTAEISRPSAHPGQHTAEVLREWGVSDIDGRLASGAARQA